jgi:adenylate cyclase
MVDKREVNRDWARFLNGDELLLKFGQAMFRTLPSPPRCALCYAPFNGPLKWPLKLMMKDPWPRNPSICRFCGDWLRKKGPGGADVELTLLFADIRGSTRLAETLSSADYVSLINRFYESATGAFVHHGAIIDQLVGDEAIGLFLPGFVGEDHPAVAYRAAVELLEATGHGQGGQPWVPVGVGVHTGTAYIGSVGSEQNFTDFTAIGDAVNTTARLASAAAAGEVVVSSTAADESSIDVTNMRNTSLDLKGKEESFPVYVASIEQTDTTG